MADETQQLQSSHVGLSGQPEALRLAAGAWGQQAATDPNFNPSSPNPNANTGYQCQSNPGRARGSNSGDGSASTPTSMAATCSTSATHLGAEFEHQPPSVPVLGQVSCFDLLSLTKSAIKVSMSSIVCTVR